ncbi:MAG: peptide chain release factor 1 [Candidatus Aminicenantia bacterium]
MFQKLDSIEEKYHQLTQLLADPAIASDLSKYKKLAKEHSELKVIVDKYKECKEVEKRIKEAKEILSDSQSDSDLKELAQEELKQLNNQKEKITEELKILLLPKDPNDEKNVFLEIRAGTGGDEATLFAQDLFRMYSRYAETRGWKLEVMSTSLSPVGGFKEIIASIEGDKVYSRLKYESGVHRVQRVPRTEASGRIHTSTVTVAVLPEADEVEVEIDPKDLKIEAFGASGPGGQHVNRTYSAIRITHLPAGIIVSCQDEKSQHRNKEKALRILRSRLLDKIRQEQEKAIAESRKNQVGSGERSEKIRTYNFPQGRVTDHRINLTLHKLESLLDGELDELIDSLITNFEAKKLEAEITPVPV